MASKGLRIPITNVLGAGDYTARIELGSRKAAVNLTMDTGSSSLVVKKSVYNSAADSSLRPTAYAQEIKYGYGSEGWAGPLVRTDLTIGESNRAITLSKVPLAIADDQLPHNFGAADGILGLAYSRLNSAYNLADYLRAQKIRPAVTYPWPFRINNSPAGLAQFQKLIRAMPQEDVASYFSLLESKKLVANKFAFYTLRSTPSMATPKPALNPLNKGLFILGGGEEQTDLFEGPTFLNVEVLDDAYYNTNLKAVQVEGCAPFAVQPLPKQHDKLLKSNSIVDSGTNSLTLAPDVLSGIFTSLGKLDTRLINLAEKGQKGLVASSLVNLQKWPNIKFVLAGDRGRDVTLTCAPSTYWQIDATERGKALFQIHSNPLPLSILGLPLMNNYYTVFDRAEDARGVIRFAPIKNP